MVSTMSASAISGALPNQSLPPSSTGSSFTATSPPSTIAPPDAWLMQSATASFTALLVFEAPVTPSMALDCAIMTCWASFSAAAPPRDSVWEVASIVTLVMLWASNVTVTVTGAPS